MNFKTAKMMTKYRVCMTFYVHFIIAISFCVSVFLWKATGKKHLLFLITCGLILWNIWLWIRFTGILDMLIPHWMKL